MGEVYQAKDFQLGRNVALKVLPEGFTQDPERLQRFEREAKLLAQLNHPNIAQIYGFETSGDTRALVMELVEGPTLAERLERGPLPFHESLLVSLQIAHALEEAHEKGIVHRDLKPQNIKASTEGKVKVLDFGVAKAMDPVGAASGGAASASQLAQSPTLTLGATVQGMILGTAAYMAPEQARGVAVDKRADIWAFGVVFHEMLTGRRLFEGELVTDVLANVLKKEVDLGALPVETPGAVGRLLRRCLERNPRNRLHDIADARIVLEEIAAGGGRAESTAAGANAPVGAARRGHLIWFAALVAVGIGATLAGRWGGRVAAGSAAEPMHLTIQLPPNLEVISGSNSILSFAPDGGSLLFTGREDGHRAIFRRDLATGRATEISGTEGGDAAFFSPDGRWIGFRARGRLMKVAAEGGRPFPIGESRGSGGAAWLADGSIVNAPIYSDGLFRLATEAAPGERLTSPDRSAGELGHWWPDPLPGGRYVLFTAFRSPVDRSRIGVLDLVTKKVRYLVEGGFFGRYVSSGHLLYAKGQRLYALPFDAASATALGGAIPLVDDLYVSHTGGYAMFAVSPGGALAYVAQSVGSPLCELVWMDRAGRASPATGERQQFLSVAISPDDRLAAVTIMGESRDLWTLSFARGTLSRLTTGDITEFDPVWSSDGRELFYIVDSPPFELHRIAVGAPDTGKAIWAEAIELDRTSIAVSPDGRSLAFVQSELETGDNLYLRPLDGSTPPRPFRAGRGEEKYATFSPDGRWVAYVADDTGRNEVYVEAVAGGGERIQVSTAGGNEPVWAANGDLFFHKDNDFYVAATQPGAPIAVEPPVRLFSASLSAQAGGDEELRPYDVTSDGQRLLLIMVPEAFRPRRIEFVTDWAATLERLAPAAK
jgi:Tol biopolymer transport system component